MTEKSFSLFEECHTSIERGQQLWRSYFSKWETLAKYEEEVPECELINETTCKVKSTRKSQHSKVLRKNKVYKKVVRKKRVPAICKNEIETTQQTTQCKNEVEDDNKQLEMILKSVLSDILNRNSNNIKVFSVLSQMVSQSHSSISTCHQVSVCSDFQFKRFSVSSRSICPPRSAVLESLPESPGFYMGNNKTGILGDGYAKHNFMDNVTGKKFLFSMNGAQVPHQSTLTNLGIKKFCKPEYMELKPLEWDFSHKSPNRICRKINKEYFIKRSFPEMNITQDGKRFRSLCLRKRTNSVSLSMENSNFITPERKPSERKCFSENVLQRKRRRPSKVFFDNEAEDSDSDDQTGNRARVTLCENKKVNRRGILGVAESDSDDCESIFDRVKTA